MRLLMKCGRRWQCLIMLFAFLVTYMIGVDKLKAAPTSNVAVTLHNLSMSGPEALKSSDESEICIFCHTPHSSNPTQPLWNHYSTWTGTFLLYSSITATSAVNNIASNLPADSISRACLSCHDGTTALNTLVNPGRSESNPGWVGANTIKQAYIDIGEGWGEGDYAYIGSNLRNMHPIGFSYGDAAGADGDLNPLAAVQSSNLKLWGPDEDKVECPTCHDPHRYYGCVGFDCTGGGSPDWDNLGYWPFLREKNVSSRLCLTCHDK